MELCGLSMSSDFGVQLPQILQGYGVIFIVRCETFSAIDIWPVFPDNKTSKLLRVDI